ncbi:hypothetical protein EVAR_65717_1 [Eumeta japonica]|uniref:Uncharacterized protein n=1 Tax=Eumeta variegata TaxID=151549 RepID=A0A4C2ABZ1_EUMVA|nr:hypothetical protein EVAR_65717_1 [Eumeta japonica]
MEGFTYSTKGISRRSKYTGDRLFQSAVDVTGSSALLDRAENGKWSGVTSGSQRRHIRNTHRRAARPGPSAVHESTIQQRLGGRSSCWRSTTLAGAGPDCRDGGICGLVRPTRWSRSCTRNALDAHVTLPYRQSARREK